MNDIELPENTVIMGGDPAMNLTIEQAEEAAGKINTESELAKLYAEVENKSWWIEDQIYDFEPDTEEYKKVNELTDSWFALADKLRSKIFEILKSEGVEIPKTEQITVLEPFMKRNGFRDGQGWWISCRQKK